MVKRNASGDGAGPDRGGGGNGASNVGATAPPSAGGTGGAGPGASPVFATSKGVCPGVFAGGGGGAQGLGASGGCWWIRWRRNRIKINWTKSCCT